MRSVLVILVCMFVAPSVDAGRDLELEQFLAEAPIVKSEYIEKGITGIVRLTLRQGDRELRAAFKTIDALTVEHGSRNPLARMNQADRYHYDIAAYRLDRLMGRETVPVSVFRVVDGDDGSITVWIDDTFDEEERRTRSDSPCVPNSFQRKLQYRYMFDILIFNEDRNQGNILYGNDDCRMHLIDHSRAFRTSTRRPDTLKNIHVTLLEDIPERLAALNLKLLRQELQPWINKVQIKALLIRRDHLLKE